MTVQLTEDLIWLHECHDRGDVHEHVSVYLLESDEGYLTIDTGSFHHREAILTSLQETVGGDDLAAMVLSHSDYPHSANVDPIREAFPSVELYASSGSPASQGLGTANRCHIGSTMDVAGRQFSFIDPPLADRSHTAWIYDDESATLFTADGFGALHAPGRCDWTSGDYPSGIGAEEIHAYHRDSLVWLRYVDPSKLERALRDIFAEHGVERVAPVHGPPIDPGDVDRYLDRLVDAAARIAENYDVPES